MSLRISQNLIDRYSTGPSPTRTASVKSLHERIRAALADAEGSAFDTFLQGSYRNGTGVADINDVDIVALYDPWRAPAPASDWRWLFNRIASILHNSSRVSGEVRVGDRCVKLTGTLKADIVPAISPRPYSSSDPIAIYSREAGGERPNYPRTHYDNGVIKQAATDGVYKATVRLFKRWARQYPYLTAPSFYLECAVHSIDKPEFSSYLPLSFAGVAFKITQYTRHSVIKSVAGDKDILVPSEWHPNDFEECQRILQRDTRLVLDAIGASTQDEADRLWKSAFGD